MNEEITVFIYDQCGQEPLSFFVLEGDYRHLNKIYVNTHVESKNGRKIQQEKEDELVKLVYEEDGKKKVVLLETFPIIDVKFKNPVHVIVCGFLP